MASIHRRPRSPYFYAAFRGPDGRSILRSTTQTDRAKALTMALEFERAANMGKRGELTEAQGREILADIMKRANTGETLHGTITTDYFRAWLATKEARKAKGTAERYKVATGRFLAGLGSRASKPLIALTAKDVDRFLDARLKSGVAPRTAILDVKIIRTALNAARRQGLIPTNPAEAVELPKIKGVERGTFMAAEVQLIVNTAEGEWKTLILLGALTGARLGDCCSMLWESVDLAGGLLTYVQKKTGRKVMVPLHPDLQTHLETLAGTDSTEPYIMPHMAGLRPGGRHGLSEGFKRIMRKAGVDSQPVKGEGVRMLSRRPFHALRHTFTSWLTNSGVPEELRMKLTGHTTQAMHRGYSHHEIDTLRGAVKKLPSVSKVRRS